MDILFPDLETLGIGYLGQGEAGVIVQLVSEKLAMVTPLHTIFDRQYRVSQQYLCIGCNQPVFFGYQLNSHRQGK